MFRSPNPGSYLTDPSAEGRIMVLGSPYRSATDLILTPMPPNPLSSPMNRDLGTGTNHPQEEGASRSAFTWPRKEMLYEIFFRRSSTSFDSVPSGFGPMPRRKLPPSSLMRFFSQSTCSTDFSGWPSTYFQS